MTQEDPIRVLVVEDSATAAELVMFLLEEGLPNHCAERAETAQSALACLDRGGLDVVLLDLNLPDSMGIQTFHKLNQHPTKTPIVVLSGDGDEDMALEAVREGAQDYLVKSRIDHEHLSRSIRFAMERVKRLRVEEDVAGARTVQEKLYPAAAPELPGFHIAGMAVPAAQVSGDYFDYIPMSRGRLGIVIGDVSGHGLGPALLMAETRAYLRALTHHANQAEISEDADVAHVLRRTNELLLTDSMWHFVTLFFMCLDPADGSYVYASAGHRVYHLRPDGSVNVLEATGPALGLFPGVEFKMAGPEVIEPGDTLFLGTDGFEETCSADHGLFGIERLLQVIRSDPDADPKSVIENAAAAARAFSGNIPQADDMTAVVIQRSHDSIFR